MTYADMFMGKMAEAITDREHQQYLEALKKGRAEANFEAIQAIANEVLGLGLVSRAFGEQAKLSVDAWEPYTLHVVAGMERLTAGWLFSEERFFVDELKRNALPVPSGRVYFADIGKFAERFIDGMSKYLVTNEVYNKQWEEWHRTNLK